MKILIIDDCEADRELIVNYLKNINIKNDIIKATQAKTLKEAFTLLMNKSFDIIILDLKLPESEGIETLINLNNFLKEQEKPIPIIILTGFDDYKVGKMAMDLGAKDFLIKDEIRSKALKQSLVFATYYNGYSNGHLKEHNN